MLIRRLIGWCLICVTLSMIGSEMMLGIRLGDYHSLTLYGLLKNFTPAMLVDAQAISFGPLMSWLWSPALTTILRLPAWMLCGAVGLYMVLTGRTKEGSRRALLE